ncbi:unnamed protein product [Mesocestoides corti]|uniref:Uncharacterized protein n=1 Tax=Mesocestoides corti TaxID=53468 RepID=A0A0R3UQD3_MESCO|nr:unnamed protein product [Mesocestoides corti]
MHVMDEHGHMTQAVTGSCDRDSSTAASCAYSLQEPRDLFTHRIGVLEGMPSASPWNMTLSGLRSFVKTQWKLKMLHGVNLTDILMECISNTPKLVYIIPRYGVISQPLLEHRLPGLATPR